MLVFTRQPDQTLMVVDPSGEAPVEITVVEVRGDGAEAQVRLEIAAPEDTPVHRLEAYRQIRESLGREREQG